MQGPPKWGGSMEMRIQQETENDGQWIGGESRGVTQGQVQKDSKGGVSDQSYQMLLAGW